MLKKIYREIFNRNQKEEMLLNYVIANAKENNPESVLNAMDKFSKEEVGYLIHLGEPKSKFLSKTV